MSQLIYKRLALWEVKPTTEKLQLGDQSYIFPREEIGNILIKMDKLKFLPCFIILDMEDHKDVLIIMGRAFLSHSKN